MDEILSLSSDTVFVFNNGIEEWSWRGDSLFTDSIGFIIYGEEPSLHVGTTPDTGIAVPPMISVYSRDEALTEGNMSKPRIFIQNTGAGELSQFTLHYYFTADQGKIPMVDQYWVPGSSVSLHQINGSLYEIQYYFDGEIGSSGAILPDMTGNVVGIHNSDWSNIDKSNDFSFSNNSTFVRNANIVVTNSGGELIYGNMP